MKTFIVLFFYMVDSASSVSTAAVPADLGSQYIPVLATLGWQGMFSPLGASDRWWQEEG